MISNYFWGGAAAPYEIEQSLRFDGSGPSRLTYDNTSGTNNSSDAWTLSFWMKRGCDIATSPYGSDLHLMMWTPSGSCANTEYFLIANPEHATTAIRNSMSFRGGGYSGNIANKLRDPSAWYHFVWRGNTGSSTNIIYINGEPVTAYNQGPSTMTAALVNGATRWSIGDSYTGCSSHPWDGYLAEVHFVDGQTKAHTDFGEFDDNGVWRPIEYTGTYGTNGYYLKFDPDATNGVGHDHSGNGHHWTATNVTTSGTGTDVMNDTPTKNFCTWNPLSNNGVTLSNGNLDTSGGASGNCKGTFAMTSGKWYWEYSNMVTGTGTPFVMGLAQVDGLTPNGHDNWRRAVYFYTDGSGNGNVRRYENGSNVSADQVTVPSSIRRFYASDVLQIAFDADTGKVWTGKNNSWLDSSGGFTGNPGNGSNPTHTFPDTDIPMTPLRDHAGVAISATANFGQRDFAYTPPTGFNALSTSNLPAPDIAKGSDYFDTVLYQAATSNGTYTHGNLDFRPDFTWIKNRDNVERHLLIDVVRGNTNVTDKFLVANDTSGEGANGVGGTTFSVTDTGYQFVETTIGAGELYFNNRTYVGWNWKAGGSGSSNSDTGTNVTSTVSVNQTAGFSIVGYQSSTNTKPLKVGHGLGVKPSFILTKNRDASASWGGYHSGLGATKGIFINSYSTAITSTDYWNNTEPTDVYFSVYDSNNTHSYGTTNDFIAYCFAEVEGFSKFGLYERNGSSEGPYVHLGFTPALILIKEYAAGTEGWAIYDNKRPGYNPNDYPLFPNTAQTESYISSTYANEIDFLSNGFKIRTSDSRYNSSLSSYRYLYAAWAVNPFGGSGVSPATAR